MKKYRYILFLLILIINIFCLSSCGKKDLKEKNIKNFIKEVSKYHNDKFDALEEGWYKININTYNRSGHTFIQEKNEEIYIFALKNKDKPEDLEFANIYYKFTSIKNYSSDNYSKRQLNSIQTTSEFFDNGKYKIVEEFQNLLDNSLNYANTKGYFSNNQIIKLYFNFFEYIHYLNILIECEETLCDYVNVEEKNNEIILSFIDHGRAMSNSFSKAYNISNYIFDMEYKVKSVSFIRELTSKNEKKEEIIATVEKVNSCEITNVDYNYSEECDPITVISIGPNPLSA